MKEKMILHTSGSLAAEVIAETKDSGIISEPIEVAPDPAFHTLAGFGAAKANLDINIDALDDYDDEAIKRHVIARRRAAGVNFEEQKALHLKRFSHEVEEQEAEATSWYPAMVTA